MYVWRVERLKQELAAGPLPPRRALPYVLAAMALLTLATNPSLTATGLSAGWNWFVTLLATALVVAGVLAAYRANGGAGGVDFLGRLLTLWWVVGIRVFVAMLVPIALVYAVFDPPGAVSNEAPHLANLLATLLFSLPLYWRTVVHFRDLRARDERGATSTAG